MKDERIKISEGTLPAELMKKLFGDGFHGYNEDYVQCVRRSCMDRPEYCSKIYKCECGGTLVININTDSWKLIKCKKCEAEWDFRPAKWKVTKRG